MPLSSLALAARPARLPQSLPVAFRVDPPYHALHPLTAIENQNLLAGSIVLLDLERVQATGEAVALVQRVRRSHAAAPIVVRIPPNARNGTLRLAIELCRLACYPLNHDDTPLEPALRQVLTDESELPSLLCDWIQHTGVTASSPILQFIRVVAEDSARVKTVVDAAQAVSLQPQSLRARCARLGLPSPVQWRILVRLLYQVLALQRNCDESLSRMAHQLGYTDHQAMCNTFRRRLRLRPSEVQRLLGWEWVVMRWLRLQHL